MRAQNSTNFVLRGLAFGFVSFLFLFLGCSETKTPVVEEGLQIENLPEGFSITDVSGELVESFSAGDRIQLRNNNDNPVVEFALSDSLDLAGLVLGRTEDAAFAHFGNKEGITGDVYLFLPCSENNNVVRICPGAESESDVSRDCTGRVILSTETTESGDYTFVNAETRSEEEDCQIGADIENFGTGAEGLTSSTLSFSTVSLDESEENDGTVSSSTTITLSNDYFSQSSGTFVEDTHYTISSGSVPGGLTLVVTVDSSTQATITLAGTATSHEDTNDADLEIEFTNEAFLENLVPLDASNLRSLSIDFDDYCEMVLYYGDDSDGDMGGRSGADTICSTNKPMGVSQANVRAFLSVDASDEIRDMPTTYSVPIGCAIVSTDDTKIADRWSDLLDGSIDNSLSTANVMDTGNWMNGSNSNGSFDISCSGWTSNAGVVEAGIGSGNATDTCWLAFGQGLCSTAREVLCLAFD